MNIAVPKNGRKVLARTKALIAHAVSEVINDPDFGLELSEEAKKRLKKARSSR